ncbi:MAG TPA: IclR family transcriptional regulator C-terminal domain-containing protein [Actinocrinis sp.]|jgi:IclR family pca regulon transcriptional regulator
MPHASAGPSAEPVGPLERGLAVLRAMARAPGSRVRASELTRATGLARSTVDRVVSTLERIGYLRAEDRELVLAPRLMELGNAYLRGSGLPAALAPAAERLAHELDESVSLAVPDRDAVRFVVQVKRRRALSVAFRVGDALPAERCAPGALFAAHWSRAELDAWRERLRADPAAVAFPAVPHQATAIAALPLGAMEEAFRARSAAAARDGWAVDDQMIELGLIAAAVPVRDGAGRIVCALSVVSHTSRHTAESLLRHVLPGMRQAAQQMSDALAAGPPGAPARRADSGAPAPDPTRAAKGELGPEYLQSLARGLRVLSALGGAQPEGATLAALAQATGLPRATVRRSVLTLVQLGYAAAEGHRFRALPRALELGYARLSELTLGDIAQPHLAGLVRQVHDSASVAVLDGEDIRYIARVAANRIMSVDITVGTRFPAYATSMGRVLLAGLSPAGRARYLDRVDLKPLTGHTVTAPAELAAILERTARAGYALVDQELEDGLRSIAVPIRGRDGSAIAAVNVSLHAARTSADEARAAVLPALRATAELISADAGAIEP